jgi:hypothetical protein
MNYIKEINLAYKDFLFIDEGHYYINLKNVDEKLISVTSFIKFFYKPFDVDYCASFTAKKEKKAIAQVKKEWAENSLMATTKGSAFHAYIEDRISRKMFNYNNDILALQAENFIKSKNDLYPVCSEVVVGSEEFKMAGSIDQLFAYISDDDLIIYDWKTNKEIFKPAYKNEKMFYPFGDLPQNDISKYTIQLNIYEYFLKLKGFKVKERKLVWFHEKNANYQEILVPNIQNEVEKALKLYIENPSIFIKE